MEGAKAGRARKEKTKTAHLWNLSTVERLAAEMNGQAKEMSSLQPGKAQLVTEKKKEKKKTKQIRTVWSDVWQVCEAFPV